jgi:YfiH family protein
MRGAGDAARTHGVDGFEWEGEHLAIALPGAHVVFTTRRGGVSAGPYRSLNLGFLTDDDPAAVTENRRRVQALTPGTLAHGHQVHGTTVRRVTEPTTERTESDGQATIREDVAPLVLTADCLPIAVAAPGGVAMLHGGWRGLAGGIVAEGVRALAELGAGAPTAAAIGPGAGGCCYQVGEEVHAHFAHHGPEVRDGRNLDLKAIARRELAAAGVDDVHDSEICTLCGDPELWFSHRRDGGVTGRQGGVAWRTA